MDLCVLYLEHTSCKAVKTKQPKVATCRDHMPKDFQFKCSLYDLDDLVANVSNGPNVST